MSRSLKGFYKLENPEKYIGKGSIIWRSSWELMVCRTCDKNPAILQWANEPFSIPYYNPVSQRQTVYIPDFLVIYEDRQGTRHQEVWEIKPRCETFESAAVTKKNKMAYAINIAKWSAARAYCEKAGLVFRVINEGDLFKAK